MSLLGKRSRKKDNESDEDDDITNTNTVVPPSKRQKRNASKESESDVNGGLCSSPLAPVNKVIVLNVGGIKYTTTLQTLSGYESMLKARFSGQYSMEAMDDGSYFFDRDGALFKYILKFLRTGKLFVPETWTKTDLQMLHEEAQYFAITAMINDISLRFFDSKIVVRDPRKIQIISEMKQLMESISCLDVQKPETWKLAYRYDATENPSIQPPKWLLNGLVCEGVLTLTLLKAGGKIYGWALRSVLGDNGTWKCYVRPPDMDCISFECTTAVNTSTALDSNDELRMLDGNRVLTDEERNDEIVRGSEMWVSARYPLAVTFTNIQKKELIPCAGDFILRVMSDGNSNSKFIQMLEVWQIPTISLPEEEETSESSD